VDLGQVMTRLSLPHDALVPRPFKAGALYAAVKNALMPPTERKKKPINKMDADFAKRHPIPYAVSFPSYLTNPSLGPDCRPTAFELLSHILFVDDQVSYLFHAVSLTKLTLTSPLLFSSQPVNRAVGSKIVSLFPSSAAREPRLTHPLFSLPSALQVWLQLRPGM
jgi:hypothetical protein